MKVFKYYYHVGYFSSYESENTEGLNIIIENCKDLPQLKWKHVKDIY